MPELMSQNLMVLSLLPDTRNCVGVWVLTVIPVASLILAVEVKGDQAMHSTTWSCSRNSTLPVFGGGGGGGGGIIVNPTRTRSLYRIALSLAFISAHSLENQIIQTITVLYNASHCPTLHVFYEAVSLWNILHVYNYINYI